MAEQLVGEGRATPVAQVPRADVLLVELQGEGVLVDVVQNRFFGLTATSTQLWRLLSCPGAGDPVAAVSQALAVPPSGARALIAAQTREWCRQRLVRPRGRAGPTVSLRDRRGDPPAQRGLPLGEVRAPGWRDYVTVSYAFAWSRWMMRHRGFAQTVRALQALPVMPGSAPDQPGVRMAHCRVRGPFVRGNPDCLAQSLTLVTALRRRGHDATLCIGLQKFPFRAHAWVELNQTVLTDTLDFVRTYALAARF